MIITNYKRPNYYKELLNNFTEGNKHFSFGVTKSFSSIKYRWVADTLFKHRNNMHTNKHRAFISFFSEKDMVLSEYGNVEEMQQDFPNYFDGVAKTKFPDFYYELTSGQYAKVGLEHTEFDEIDYVDASDRLFSNDDDSSSYDIVLGTLININVKVLSGNITVSVGSNEIDWSSGNQFSSFTMPSGTRIEIDNVDYEILLTTSSLKATLTENYAGSSGIKAYATYEPVEKRVESINHIYADAPVFVSMGYKFHDYTPGNDRFVWANEPESIDINFNNFKVILNDDEKDIYTNEHLIAYVESPTTPVIASGPINLDGTGDLVTPVAFLKDPWLRTEAAQISGEGFLEDLTP